MCSTLPVTFTIAGRSTRPFNFQPVRNTSPTRGSPATVVLHHRFVHIRVERLAQRGDRLEAGPFEHAEQLGVHELDALAQAVDIGVAAEIRELRARSCRARAGAARRALRSPARRARSARAARACGSSRSRPASVATFRAGRHARAATGRCRRRPARPRPRPARRLVGSSASAVVVRDRRPHSRPRHADRELRRRSCRRTWSLRQSARRRQLVVDDLGVGDLVVSRRRHRRRHPPTAAPARSGTAAS